MIRLPSKPKDDLNWKIEGNPSVFEFDLGLSDPYFPLEDELTFNALAMALTRFTQQVWPLFPHAKGILYRGKGDFSSFFHWSEGQEKNYKIWKEDRPFCTEAHLKRLFCAEAFLSYFQMLAHKLPDELPLQLIMEPSLEATLAETLHLFSKERFEHFQIDYGFHFTSNIGVCFPTDPACSKEVLNSIDLLLETLPSFKPVYESILTEEWEGLDEIHVFSETLTVQGKRKLMGFKAAGGKVIEEKIRGRGI